MMGLSVKSRQQSAHRMIQRYGGDNPIGLLDRSGTTRAATMCRMDYTPKANGVALDKVSKIRISAIGLATAPDFEQDEIIYGGERYRILDEPTGPRLGAAFVYYDCNVAYTKIEP